jgi:formylglycine-generating enzyme required for sulfatase activity
METGKGNKFLCLFVSTQEVSMASVSIGGNVTDSVIVLGNNNHVIRIGDVHGGTVNIVTPSDKPKYSARATPVTIKPRAFPALLDRETETQVIQKAVQLSIPISVWGNDGIGKTSFIRYLTHTLDASQFTSGMVYLNASSLGYEDLLQALFDLFHDSDPSYKPNTSEILHALQNIKALIFLDDFQIGRDEAASILNAAPNSLFVLSSAERSLWGEGETIPLKGLPESEALTLFERELSRTLTEQERTIAEKICSVLNRHPLQILQAASLVREDEKLLEDVLSGITVDKAENKSMSYMNMADLNDSEKQVLALFATAGGNVVSLKHIKRIFKDDDKQDEIQNLIALGLVQAHSPRFSITHELASAVSSSWDLVPWQDALLEYAIKWLSQQPASNLVEESSGLLIHIIKNAGERKKWREVIQLGRALEKFMVFYKRWQTWSDILNFILTAAKALNDSRTQAWALHQLGSRALYLGHMGEAKTFLSQALDIRRAIGDKAGQAITQHNINTLNGIVTPAKGNTTGCRKYLLYGVGVIVAMTILAAIVAVVIFVLLPPKDNGDVVNFSSQTPSLTTTHTLTATMTGTPSPTQTPTRTPTSTMTPTITLTSTPVVFNPRPERSDVYDFHGVPMRVVPAGDFWMGEQGSESDTSPIHSIYLDTYYIDKYEVTNHLYKICVDAGKCTLPVANPGSVQYNNYQPVVSVTWFQAFDYCEWRGARLPTEAEWEKAARGTSTNLYLYPWGGEYIDCSLSNYANCIGSLTNVGNYADKSKSPYGLYDMAGNVWEWVFDWYSYDYYSVSPARNPAGPDFSSGTFDAPPRRVLRGGSYVDDQTYQRVTYRNHEIPGNTNWNIGFRCAKDDVP